MTRQSQTLTVATMIVVSGIALVACGRAPTGDTARVSSAPPEVATLDADQPTGLARVATTAEVSPEPGDELRRREAELAARERELRVQQDELRRERERLEAARGGGGPSTSAGDDWYDADQATAPAATAPAHSSIQKVPTLPIVVPPGTPLKIELAANVDTRIARVGDQVEGRLASDLVVGDRRAAVAGAAVTGRVTELVPGREEAGGEPTLVVTFESLQAANGATVPIVATFRKQDDSDPAREAAEGAGGAAFAAAAQRTGGDVKLRAGTVITAPTETSLSIY